MNTASDSLDLAYFVFGVKRYLQDGGNPPKFNSGELEFVAECLPLSAALDVELPEAFSGVFVYDVAEPLGEFVANIVGNGDIATLTQAREYVATLIQGMCL